MARMALKTREKSNPACRLYVACVAFNVVALQVLLISVGKSMQHTRDIDRIANLYASAEGVAHLIAIYREVLGKIRTSGPGLRKTKTKRDDVPRTQTERDLQFLVIELMQECSRYRIAPPSELADLVSGLFKAGDEKRRSTSVRFPSRKVWKIKAETGLRGRKLARESRRRGLNVSDRSVARHEKDFVPH
jgi:hypothetical protein